MPQDIGLYQECCDFEEAAEYLGYAAPTLRAQHINWGIPSLRIAGRTYFMLPDLQAWMRKRVAATIRHEHQSAAANASYADRQGAK